MKNGKKGGGFTLIELIVVIAIIAVLSSVVTPSVFRAIDKAKVTRMVSDLKNVKTAVMTYFADTGQWPALGEIKNAHPILKNPGVTGWDGPYLEKAAKAPSWTGYVSAGCSPPGYYFLASYNGWCCYDSYGYFDLDRDGVNEVTTGRSACIYGVPAPVRKGVNMAVDSTNSADERTGQVKVWEGGLSGGCPGFIFYYVGQD